MKKEDLYEVLADIDENEVKKVKEYTNKKKKFPLKWVSVAALATAAVIAVSITMNGYLDGKNTGINTAEVPVTTSQGVTLQAKETTTDDMKQAEETTAAQVEVAEVEKLKRPTLMLPMEDEEFIAALKNYTIDKDLGNVFIGNIL